VLSDKPLASSRLYRSNRSSLGFSGYWLTAALFYSTMRSAKACAPEPTLTTRARLQFGQGEVHCFFRSRPTSLV